MLYTLLTIVIVYCVIQAALQEERDEEKKYEWMDEEEKS